MSTTFKWWQLWVAPWSWLSARWSGRGAANRRQQGEQTAWRARSAARNFRRSTYQYQVLDQVGNATVGDDEQPGNRSRDASLVAVVRRLRRRGGTTGGGRHWSVGVLILLLCSPAACHQLQIMNCISTCPECAFIGQSHCGCLWPGYCIIHDLLYQLFFLFFFYDEMSTVGKHLK